MISGFDFFCVVKIEGKNVSERWVDLFENFDTRVDVVVVNFADFFFVVIVVAVVADVVIDSL